MVYINRLIESSLHAILQRGKSILLLGPRQTGKTTLFSRFNTDLTLSFIQPKVRQHYERDSSLLSGEIEFLAEQKKKKPLVLLDEIQKVPEAMDIVQDLIDRQIAQFILTGSSARKLRSNSKVNLLPGRVVSLRLDPLILSESASLSSSIIDLLLYGSLPGILSLSNPLEKEQDLTSYVTTYLEEEIRAEAVVRKLGAFSRFLLLAAAESGNLINFRKLAQEIGISHTTIGDYYQILEDCLIVERIEPFLPTSTRRRLTKSPKYLFFDLGVRRLSADEGIHPPTTYLGKLFEQWVGLELIRCARLTNERTKVYFWRDMNGPEVDWIVKKEDHLIPIEVKWTTHPTRDHSKHLELFKSEYPNVSKAYIVCQIPRQMKLSEGIYAIPWQEVDSIILEK